MNQKILLARESNTKKVLPGRSVNREKLKGFWRGRAQGKKGGEGDLQRRQCQTLKKLPGLQATDKKKIVSYIRQERNCCQGADVLASGRGGEHSPN